MNTPDNNLPQAISVNVADVLAQEGALQARLRSELYLKIAHQEQQIGELRRRLGLQQQATERLQEESDALKAQLSRVGVSDE